MVGLWYLFNDKAAAGQLHAGWLNCEDPFELNFLWAARRWKHSKRHVVFCVYTIKGIVFTLCVVRKWCLYEVLSSN